MRNQTKSDSQPTGTYPSIANCASATGVPVAVLRQAKRDGCPAFDAANRVRFAEFIRWYFSEQRDGCELLDYQQEQAALAKERRLEISERRALAADKEQMIAEVEAMLNELLVLPLRAWLAAAPSSLAARCNPTQPDVARRVLDEALFKELFPLIRDKLNASGRGCGSVQKRQVGKTK